MSNDTLISQELIESVFSGLYDLQDFKKIVKGLYKFLRENEYSNNEIRHAFQTFFWNRKAYIEMEFKYKFQNVGSLVENLIKNENNTSDNESDNQSTIDNTTNTTNTNTNSTNTNTNTTSNVGTSGTTGTSSTDGASGASDTDVASGTYGASGTSGTDATSGASGTDATSGASGTDSTADASGTGSNHINEESTESSDSSETNDMNHRTRRIHTIYSGQPLVYDPSINEQFTFPQAHYQTFTVPLNLFGSMLPAQQPGYNYEEYVQGYDYQHYIDNFQNILINNISQSLIHAQQNYAQQTNGQQTNGQQTNGQQTAEQLYSHLTTDIPGLGTALNFFNIFLNAAPVGQTAAVVKNVLNKEQLEKLTKYEYKNIDKEKYKECSVCLEDYTEENILRILKCEHGFHVDCIDKWLTECDYKCPVCRDDSNEHCHQEEDGTELNIHEQTEQTEETEQTEHESND